MTAELAKEFQRRFGDLAKALEQEAQNLSELDAAVLAEVNKRNATALEKLRVEISVARAKLPDGREIALGGYAALGELARANGVSEEVVFGRLKEIEDGRVVSSAFTNLGLTDISALSGLGQLRSLGLNNNRLTDISALAGLGQLRSLGLNNSQLTDISALSGLGQLKELYLSNNRLTDISALSGLGQLKALYLSNNRLTDISSLSGLLRLGLLYLDNNRLTKAAKLTVKQLRKREVTVRL